MNTNKGNYTRKAHICNFLHRNLPEVFSVFRKFHGFDVIIDVHTFHAPEVHFSLPTLQRHDFYEYHKFCAQKSRNMEILTQHETDFHEKEFPANTRTSKSLRSAHLAVRQSQCPEDRQAEWQTEAIVSGRKFSWFHRPACTGMHGFK